MRGAIIGSMLGGGATWAVLTFGWPSLPWLIAGGLAVLLIVALAVIRAILGGLSESVGRGLGW